MAHTMSPSDFQAIGRSYFKLKQYDKAAEAFSSAIEMAPSISLYDHRAATYDRLQDYNAAVKDGREMIKMDKQDVKGYLRTASILEKMEKLHTALSIYKYGMKNVPVLDKNFKLLQQLHDKGTRKLSPANSVDPLTILPTELAEIMLEYLPFRHVVSCMRVSKGWRDCIAKLPRLWLYLDLSGARRPVPRKFIDKAIRYSQNKLTRATIHRFGHIDMLENIAKACGGLTELEFISLPHAMSSTLIEIVQHAPKLEKFVVHPQITIDTVAQVLNNSPSLKHVAFNTVRGSLNIPNWRGPFPNLVSCKIHLDRTALRGFGTIETLIERAGALKSLDVRGFILPTIFIPKASASNPPLTTLILHQVQLTQFPCLPPTLHKLVIEAEGASEVTDEGDVLISRVPALRHLSLVNVNSIYAKWFPAFLDLYIDPDSNSREVQLLDDTVPLEHFTLRGLPASPEDGLFINDRSLLFSDYASSGFHSSRILTPALKHLDIATHRCNDDEIEHLLKHKVSGLRSIDLSCTQITGASIKMLVDGLPGLRRIKADECPKISGRDAIEYAMRKGVAVSRSMNESKGSRKIRYG